ncbi:MAG: Salicylate hydroxylase [Alphaproteobacteria bacterium]|jgi:2-polyprenyl-6-methoxyphenol hydroxylase-like FAD-dependent oxidoreductase|nr:Salicylate hydroxylase [Alphaproteobacteria bacterium]
MTETTLQVDCCIAGGGPAGMMLGLLLARAGVSVAVLEKHGDFLRDFRGDTIHPSTLELIYELGLLEQFLALPHQKTEKLVAQIGDDAFTIADFTHLPVRCPYIAFMPQWDFLNFLAAQARTYTGFHLYTRAKAVDLLRSGDVVTGLRAETADGSMTVHCKLVVGADGRTSKIRTKAGLVPQTLGAPMDVLWFSIPRAPGDPAQAMGRFDAGRIFVLINRGDYWQSGFVIPKGSAEQVRARGLPAFRAAIAGVAPFLGDRLDTIADWEQVKLLTVGVDRLEQWYRPGVLCIGDAAHTMSPVGGVGINLAVQDAVAAANILAGPLRDGTVTPEHLRQVQRRRSLPVRVVQRLQVIVQKRIIGTVLTSSSRPQLPRVVLWLLRLPFFPRLPARLIGLGLRREHIRTPVR